MTTSAFSQSFDGFQIRFFSAFKGPLYFWPKPSKISGFIYPHFPTVPFSTSSGSPVKLVFLQISMLILFPKLEPPCLIRWSLVLLPSYRQNPLYQVSQMETLHFHIPSLISTVPFLHFSSMISPIVTAS